MSAVQDVEIKVTINPGQATEAARTLGLRSADAEQRDIWFCEYLNGQGGPIALPLLGQGLILRLRRKHGGADDSTVKVRRREDEPLLENWRRELIREEKFRVEGDWVGRRHMEHELAAEHWQAGELRFLELSIRVPRSVAEAAQDAFERQIRQLGLDVDPVQETKTRLVLEHFAAARAAG
jgi:hypothetical protein